MAALACSLALPALAQDAGTNEDPKILYTLGFDMGQRLKSAFAPTPEEVAAIQRGMNDSANEAKPLVDLQSYGQAKVG
ncbi:MAG TPA: hypothetical protein VH208_12250, partial [Myxococcaceae bacterium]|nr:hypothetical protein [Myxococcaceae bacterium]